MYNERPFLKPEVGGYWRIFMKYSRFGEVYSQIFYEYSRIATPTVAFIQHMK